MPDSSPLKLFIIYAREDQPALLELKAHLRPLELRRDLTVWDDGEILPGEDWGEAIKGQLATADIVLLFISKYFFNSEYIEKEELKKALERHKKGEAVVVPVIVKPCLWEAHEEIAALQVLPKDGKAVSSWEDADEAWENVAKGIFKIINLKKRLAVDTNKIKQQTELALSHSYRMAVVDSSSNISLVDEDVFFEKKSDEISMMLDENNRFSKVQIIWKSGKRAGKTDILSRGDLRGRFITLLRDISNSKVIKADTTEVGVSDYIKRELPKYQTFKALSTIYEALCCFNWPSGSKPTSKDLEITKIGKEKKKVLALLGIS